MSDWLTKLAAKRRADEAKRARQISTETSYEQVFEQTVQLRYNQNKDTIERIYVALTDYARRASDAGFDVNTERSETNGFALVGHYRSWVVDRYQTNEARLELTPWNRTPWNSGFLIRYNGRVSPTPESFISLWRVNEKVIANWVRWSSGEGPDNPVEERWFRFIFIGGPIALAVVVLLVLLFSK